MAAEAAPLADPILSFLRPGPLFYASALTQKTLITGPAQTVLTLWMSQACFTARLRPPGLAVWT